MNTHMNYIVIKKNMAYSSFVYVARVAEQLCNAFILVDLNQNQSEFSESSLPLFIEDDDDLLASRNMFVYFCSELLSSSVCQSVGCPKINTIRENRTSPPLLH